jgi:Leucine-rich repeat (LRR) protein
MQARLDAYRPAEGKINLCDLFLTAEDCIWAVTRLADSERFPGLHTLDISDNDIGDEGAKAIAGALPWCPGLTRIRTLFISLNSIGDVGAAALAGVHLAADGTATLIEGTGLRGLKQLNISVNSIGAAGAAALAGVHLAADGAATRMAGAGLSALNTLGIHGNRIGDVGAAALAGVHLAPDGTATPIAGGGLTQLRVLDIAVNSIHDAGVAALAGVHLAGYSLATRVDGAGLRALAELYISGNSIGDRGAAALAGISLGWPTDSRIEGAGLSGLNTLHISGNEIGTSGAAALAASLTQLRTLYMSGNRIGDAGAAALAGVHLAYDGTSARIPGAGLNELRELDIGSNSIRDAQTIVDLIEALRPGGNPGGKLTKISLFDNLLKFTAPGWEPIGVPPEVRTEPDPAKVLAELRRLMPKTLVDRHTGAETVVVTSDTVDWVRATVLGRKEIGKSHLFRRLIFRTFQEPPKTQAWECGILRLEGVGPSSRTISARVHDLGGDPDLHGAHSTFLSDKRNIYLAVCNASESRRQTLLDYWMRVVKAYGVYNEREGDDAPRDVIPPTTVLLSWADQGVHEDFADKRAVAESIKRMHAPLEAIVVDRYWDPHGGRRAGDLKHEDRLEAVRDALRDMVRLPQTQAQLNTGYPKGYRAAIADFDSLDDESNSKSSLFDGGPMTVQAVREAFFRRTNDPVDKTSDVGIGLLRNIGLAICPELDARDRADKDRRANVAHEARLAPPREDPANLRALRDLVFGVEWLKKPTYHVVRTGHFEQSMGVVTRDVLIEQLGRQLGESAAWAEKLFELLKWQRLIFPYAHAEDEKYLIVDRLKPLDMRKPDDRRIAEDHDREFGGARHWVMRLDLLLDSHLPQFIGHAYASLTGNMYVSEGSELSATVRRDRIVVACGTAPGVQALITVDLNEAQVHARVIGGTDKQQDDFVVQIGLGMMQVTGKLASFVESTRASNQTSRVVVANGVVGDVERSQSGATVRDGKLVSPSADPGGTGVPPTREQRATQTQGDGVASDAAVLAQLGPDGVSAQDIADAIGCSKQSVLNTLNRLRNSGKAWMEGSGRNARWYRA